jgi:hypothetical protein
MNPTIKPRLLREKSSGFRERWSILQVLLALAGVAVIFASVVLYCQQVWRWSIYLVAIRWFLFSSLPI